MKTLFLISICLCGMFHGSFAQTETKYHPVLVELFTSEGCSSCPPADDLMAELQKEYQDAKKPVFFVAYHVDYWDYLGWKDRFSSVEHTQRQREYSRSFRLNSIYTPQAVVNGKKEMVGAKRSLLKETIEKELTYAASDQLVVKTVYDPNLNKISVSYAYTGNINDKEIHFILLEKEQSVKVTRGENAGNTLHHIHIVKQHERSVLKAKGNHLFVVKDKISLADYNFIAFVQSISDKAILSVTEVF